MCGYDTKVKTQDTLFYDIADMQTDFQTVSLNWEKFVTFPVIKIEQGTYRDYIFLNIL